MSLDQIRSTRAKAKMAKNQVQKRAKYAQGVAKKAKGKTAKLDKVLVLHHLLFMGMALVASLALFIPLQWEGNTLPMPKLVFIGLVAYHILMGRWHIRRAERKIRWYNREDLWPESAVNMTVPLFMALVIFLISLLVPATFTENRTLAYAQHFSAYAGFMAMSTMGFFVPWFSEKVLESALSLQPKKYKLWFWPKDYKEKQPTWNRDLVVFADLTFIRDVDNPVLTEVKVKLPQEALFGEMIYLFIQDYNNNRSPEAPIKDLWSPDGDMGWLFYVPGKLGSRDYIDPDLTVGENPITENCTVIFERTWEE